MAYRDDPTYRGPVDGPWPFRKIDFDLEEAEAEWLMTNELGVYAMSTLALMHTRRHHGLLVSEVPSEVGKFVLLSHLEMTLEVGGKTYQLSTHQFPGVAPTPGYRFLESYTQDPLPRWVFRLPTGTVERTVTVPRGKRSVIVATTWSGKERARLWLRPLLPMRAAGSLMREHGAMLQKVTVRRGEVEVQPVATLPPLVFRHQGVFMGSPDWWRKFEYLDDRGRYEDFQEDMWSPGVFELSLESRKTEYWVATVDERPTETPEQLVMNTAQYWLTLDPGQIQHPAVRALSVASDVFVLGDSESVAAGYPWLDVWTRDLLLSMPGIHLLRKRELEAARALIHLGENLVDGFLPRRAFEEGGEPSACVDASLLLFPVVRRVLARAPLGSEYRDALYRLVVGIFERIVAPRRDLAWLSEDGLLMNAGPRPLTWMDATSRGTPITPRFGAAIELQAHFALACEVLSELARERGDRGLALRALDAYERIRDRVRERFWCEETGYPFDCLAGTGDQTEEFGDDASVRPNALIALATAPGLFEPWQRREILARVDELLLTERGVRTLDPRDSRYVGISGGLLHERRNASHQGTAWPHLLLYYVRASLAERPDERSRLVSLVTSALYGGRAVGHVAQMADGDPPHRPRGSPAYAAATAMLLEALVVDLRIEHGE